uniref:RING-type E3 ubiquitin transferase n=1 Tax=Strix occidentalis caurina TaxID=311401 RepID=A0A8D0KXL6_STROC
CASAFDGGELCEGASPRGGRRGLVSRRVSFARGLGISSSPRRDSEGPGPVSILQRVTPARGSSSSSSALPSLPQQANMAEESEWSCPICGETQDGAAYAKPCLHQFCLGCIVRWAKRKASCPLCGTLQPTSGHADDDARVARSRQNQGRASSWGACQPPRGLGGAC